MPKLNGSINEVELLLIDNSKLQGQKGGLCFAFSAQILRQFHNVSTESSQASTNKTKNVALGETAFEFILKYQDTSAPNENELIATTFQKFRNDGESTQESTKDDAEPGENEDEYFAFYTKVLAAAWECADFTSRNNFYKKLGADYLDLAEMFSYLYGFELFSQSALSSLSKSDLEKHLSKYGPMMIHGTVGIKTKKLFDTLPEVGAIASEDGKSQYKIRHATLDAYDTEDEPHHVVLLPTSHNQTPFIFYIDPWDPTVILMVEWSTFRDLITNGRLSPYYLPCGVPSELYAHNEIINGEDSGPERVNPSCFDNINNCSHVHNIPRARFVLKENFAECIEKYNEETNEEWKVERDLKKYSASIAAFLDPSLSHDFSLFQTQVEKRVRDSADDPNITEQDMRQTEMILQSLPKRVKKC